MYGKEFVLECPSVSIIITPRMRGKAFPHRLNHDTAGITPAYAGKRTALTSLYHAFMHHPRICGEKDFVPVKISYFTGSPPHMRGKSSALITAQGCRWDHPRICGEKFCHFPSVSYFRGSPPHMRGKGARRQTDEAYSRITPAYAGKRRGFRPLKFFN